MQSINKTMYTTVTSIMRVLQKCNRKKYYFIFLIHRFTFGPRFCKQIGKFSVQVSNIVTRNIHQVSVISTERLPKKKKKNVKTISYIFSHCLEQFTWIVKTVFTTYNLGRDWNQIERDRNWTSCLKKIIQNLYGR